MNRKAYASILALIFLAFVFLTGCNNSKRKVEGIAATSGTPQSAQISTAFAAPLVATVTTNGKPTSGVSVIFTAPASGASGTFANGTATDTETTDSSGNATSAVFTANTTAGAYTVTAATAGVTTSVTFSLTNTAGPAASIAVSSGSPQSAAISTAFALPLVAVVLDSGSNPVSGASVVFTAPATGASGTFANATATETDTTDANGLATSTVFTANATTGAYTVTAAVTGVTATANFILTNTLPPASITATSGTPQSAPVSTAFALPLVATVLDASSNPVEGAVVTFTAPATGASGTFVNTTATDTETTDASGVATSTTFTANATAGAYTVSAAVAGVTATADFSLTNTVAPTSFTYAFYLTGLEVTNPVPIGPNFYALAGVVTVATDGTVTAGEQDYNDASGLTSPQPSGDAITGGTLTVDPTTGQGTLTLITDNTALGVAGTETLGVQFANTSHALIVQFDGSATSSGSLDLQTATTASDGGYAFTLSGVDSGYFSVVYGGVFSISTGTAVAGVYDEDDAGAVTTNTAFTGTASVPDAFGRGTVTGTNLGGYLTTLNYYIVGPEVMRIIDVDAADSSVGSAFGQGTGTFDNTSLVTSVFGISANTWGNPYAAAGAITTSGNGSFSGVGDDDELFGAGIVTDSSVSGIYSIGSNGYGTMTINGLGSIVSLGIYATDPTLNLNDPNNATGGGGALIADLDGSLNGTGVLIPQTDTLAADFTGNYAFGAQDYWVDTVPNEWEFDFVGQGSVTAGVLAGTGLVSDPFGFFTPSPASTTDSGVIFAGTATPDGVTAGRYTIPLAVTVVGGAAVPLDAVIYQAGGGQLFWVGADAADVFLGSLEQQGSLSGLPAAKKGAAKANRNRTRNRNK